MKKLKRINIQTIFHIFSILFILSVSFYFIGRFIYYKLDSEKERIVPNTLADRLIMEDYGNYQESENDLSYINGIYRYVGNANYNYVRYKGFLWRVIKINEDKSISLITEDSVTSLPYGNSLEDSILSWLNKDDKENTGIMEMSLENEGELINTKFCIDTFQDLKEASCFDTDSHHKISILTVDDYLSANANKSYLNNGESFWTSNKFDEKNSWFISEDGRLSYNDTTNKYGIRPVITIDGESIIYSGNGTSDDPYLLNHKKTNTLSDTYVGDYVLYNNQVWKVVSKEKEKIKIVSGECIKDHNNVCLKRNYSEHSNDIEKSELMIYLNKNYYQSLQNKEFIKNGNFYTGTYSLMENDYRSTFKNEKSLIVGFLSIGEIFAYDINDTYLMTTNPNNELSIYSVKNHSPYQNIVTEPLAIRPSIYLNSNIIIKTGNGDYLSPYQLGGIET